MKQRNWVELWDQLSRNSHKSSAEQRKKEYDAWGTLVHKVNASTKRRWKEPDCLMQFVLDRLSPKETVLDIGAGTGGWSIPIAKKVQKVTVIEPSSEMLSVLCDNVAAEGLSNIVVVRSQWENAVVEPHDVALCSHGMYESPDLVSFVRKMCHYARRRCYLVMRVPSCDGIIGELSEKIHGQWHDSPNFIVGYNVLISVGIYANVLVEPTMRPWSSETVEEAMIRTKRMLRLRQPSPYDDLIHSTLARRLIDIGNRYEWPDGKRSALIWWNTTISGSIEVNDSIDENNHHGE